MADGMSIIQIGGRDGRTDWLWSKK
jgi:hypothetical protein